MSESRGSSRETQALVQSMLQRLKLEAGTEIQGGSLPASPAAARPDRGQSGNRAPLQETLGPNSSPAQNGFGTALVGSRMGTDGDVIGEGLPDSSGQEVRRWGSRQEFRFPGRDSDLDRSATGAKVNEEQGLVDGPILDRRKELSARLNSPKAFSSPSCKDNTAGDSVDSGGAGQTATSSVASGRLFPVDTQEDAEGTQEDAEGTSSARTECKMEGGKEGKSVIEESLIRVVRGAVTGDVQGSASQYPSNSRSSNPEMTAESGALSQTVSVNRDSSPSPVQGFSPRVYAWSLKGPSTGSGEMARSQDVEIGSKMPNSSSAPLQRNRASGSKTKRWTQKIKEKFKERAGSLKKRKEQAQKEGVKVEEEGKISTQNERRTTEDASSVPSKTLETTCKPTDTASTRLEASAAEMRSSNDFDIGLGSFSLLEEIRTGQYWANFLSPALSDVSTTQRPAGQHAGQSNVPVLAGFQEDSRSPGSVDRRGDPGVAIMATSPVHETMDTSEPDGSSAATDHDPRAQPMDQRNQSDVASEEQAPTPGERDQSAGVVDNTILRSQILRNRKRVHCQSLERTADGGKAERRVEEEEGGERDGTGLQDEPLSSTGLANGPATVEKELAEDNGLLYLYSFKSHQSPSSPAPRELVPKGVLKHTKSTVSECSVSMETATKKRRMESVRRVHFSEELVVIAPAVLDISMGTDSEEESWPEENSVTEEEGTPQVPGDGAEEAEEAAPRSPVLPGWIRALKRRSGRKPKR